MSDAVARLHCDGGDPSITWDVFYGVATSVIFCPGGETTHTADKAVIVTGFGETGGRLIFLCGPEGAAYQYCNEGLGWYTEDGSLGALPDSNLILEYFGAGFGVVIFFWALGYGLGAVLSLLKGGS